MALSSVAFCAVRRRRWLILWPSNCVSVINNSSPSGLDQRKLCSTIPMLIPTDSWLVRKSLKWLNSTGLIWYLRSTPNRFSRRPCDSAQNSTFAPRVLASSIAANNACAGCFFCGFSAMSLSFSQCRLCLPALSSNTS